MIGAQQTAADRTPEGGKVSAREPLPVGVGGSLDREVRVVASAPGDVRTLPRPPVGSEV